MQREKESGAANKTDERDTPRGGADSCLKRRSLLFDILIQKLEYVRFPCGDVLVQHAVSVLRG
jgi:hypothetical protein